jgi:hypothetical protein
MAGVAFGMSHDWPNPYEPPRAPGIAPPEEPARGRIWPVWLVIATALVLPGLPSLAMLGWRRRGLVFLVLVLVVPAAFAFFGPIWDLILFAGADRPTREFGLWPFLATCGLTPITSVALGVRDRTCTRSPRSTDGFDVCDIRNRLL